MSPNQNQTSKNAYRIAGGLIGFIFGLMLFIKFNYLWYELGKFEVFGFKAAVAMILMLILPFFLISAPFWGIWLGAFAAGRLYNKIYGMQKDLRQKGITMIGAGLAIAVVISGYLIIAKYSFQSWPFGKFMETSEFQLSPDPSAPAPVLDKSSPPSAASDSTTNKISSESREKIAAYLKSAEKLLADFDSYQEKSQNALKQRSLSGIADSKKDLELITGQWKALVSPSLLKLSNQLMLEAFDYENQSITLIEEGLKNKDSSKIIQAVGFADKTADTILKAKEEMRRVMLNMPN